MKVRTETKHEFKNQGEKVKLEDSPERLSTCTYSGRCCIARAIGQLHDIEIVNQDPAACITSLLWIIDLVRRHLAVDLGRNTTEKRPEDVGYTLNGDN